MLAHGAASNQPEVQAKAATADAKVWRQKKAAAACSTNTYTNMISIAPEKNRGRI
jgi:hypothetical protein